MTKPTFPSFKLRGQDYRQELRRYILLLVIPLVFCIVLYFSVQEVLTRQIHSNAEHTVEQVYAYTSSMMHEVDIVSGAIFSDMAALRNSSSERPLPYDLDNPYSICRQLEIRKWQSHYIKHVYLISQEWQRIYSDNGYYKFSSLDSVLALVGASQAELEQIQDPTWNMQTSSHLTDPYCILPYRDEDGTVIGQILITLDLTVFVNTLSDVNADFVCLYNADTMITSQLLSTDTASVDWSDEAAVGRALGMKVRCFHVKTDGYTCMTAIRWSRYYYPFRVISLCFVIYAAVVFLLGFIYLSRVSQARYQQLSDLVSALPQDSSTAVSYPELLPRVQQELLSLRDKEAAGAALENERVLRNILYQQYNPSSLEKRLQRVGIPDGDTICYVAVFYVRSLDTVALISSDTGDAQDMVSVIFQSSLRQFAGESLHHISFSDPGRFTTVFFEPSDDSFSKNVSATCASICKFMGDSYGITVQAAVSGAVPARELDQGFRQAQSLEKFALAIDSDSHIFSQDVLDRSGELLLRGNFIRQEQILLNTVLMGKYDLIPAMTASILREHVTPIAADYDMAMGRLRSVANILSEALLSSLPEGIDAAAAAKQLQTADSITELEDAVSAVYGRLAQTMTTGIRTYKEVEQARSYIRDNLSDQNLNVTMICEAVGVIVQRLTPMFREQLDMGIAEYVNYCRIEQAKKLLSGTKLTVKKVGEEVGYSTTDTFTRNFRKMENMTPTEYRRIVT